MGIGNLISGSSAFYKYILNIWKFIVHVLLKPGLENFEHYFASVWDECNCAVIGTFFGIAFLQDWNENFSSPGATTEFSRCAGILSAELSQHHILGFGSTGIPSPPLALFILMLPKTHLTSHSRMSGSRGVITPSWLSGSLRPFSQSSSVYSCHLLKSSASVRFIPFLSFIVPIFEWNVPLVFLISWGHLYPFPFYCFPLFLCIDHLGSLSYLPSLFFGTLHSDFLSHLLKKPKR